MEITKTFFLNLSFLIIILFLGFVFLQKSRRLSASKLVISLFFIAILWICIQFSYTPIPSARYDLRIIPFVIGSLYQRIGPLLAITIIILRIFFGVDIGFYQSLVLFGVLGIVIWKLCPWFWEKKASQRIFISVCLGEIIGIFTVSGMEFTDFHPNPLDVWFAFLVIQPLGIGIITTAIELVRRNREMQQQLIKAEKLKAVEQMGAAISHEIRNPLTTASGFVQLLQDDHLPRHKRREYLLLVKDELNSAERVIQDYLTFAKPTLESLEELNVKSELKQIIMIIQPLANQYSVEIKTDFSVIGYIKGDRHKFRQCFVNVLKNAVESMPNGGVMTIGTDYYKNYVTIMVKDTGIGMTTEQVERLGEPFYSTKGKNGTGLGMMVVYSLVRAMKGKIRVESEVGAGTTFYFEFHAIMSSQLHDG